MKILRPKSFFGSKDNIGRISAQIEFHTQKKRSTSLKLGTYAYYIINLLTKENKKFTDVANKCIISANIFIPNSSE